MVSYEGIRWEFDSRDDLYRKPNELNRVGRDQLKLVLSNKGGGLRTVTLVAIQHAHGKIYEEVSPNGYSIYDVNAYNLADVLSLPKGGINFKSAEIRVLAGEAGPGLGNSQEWWKYTVSGDNYYNHEDFCRLSRAPQFAPSIS